MNQTTFFICVFLLTLLAPQTSADCISVAISRSVASSESGFAKALVDVAAFAKAATEDIIATQGTCTSVDVTAVAEGRAEAYAEAVAQASTFTKAIVEGEPECGSASARGSAFSKATAEAIATANALAISQVFGVGFAFASSRASAQDIVNVVAAAQSSAVSSGGTATSYSDVEARAVAVAIAEVLAEAIVEVYKCA